VELVDDPIVETIRVYEGTIKVPTAAPKLQGCGEGWRYLYSYTPL